MRKIPKVLLLIETSSAYDQRLLRGISRYVKIHGPWIFYKSPPNYYREPVERKKVLIFMKNWGVDGIIIREPREDDEILSLGLPTITSPGRIKGLPAVITDSAAIAKIAAEHLLGCGFRSFAYCGFDDLKWSRVRGENFRKFIAKSCFETSIYQQPKSQDQRSWDKEQAYLLDWLKLLPKPLGLMACNDCRGG